jgi:hypothetical protein
MTLRARPRVYERCRTAQIVPERQVTFATKRDLPRPCPEGGHELDRKLIDPSHTEHVSGERDLELTNYRKE